MAKSTDCLVSFSSKGREDYNTWLLRMLDSALIHWKGDYLIYSTDHELQEYRGITIHKGLPPSGLPHSEMPYQFKAAIIQEARNRGYERVVWLDSSIELCNDITALFWETGVTVFENLGHPLYKFISDEAAMMLNVTDEQLKTIPQIWGGVLFFDFSKENACDVFWNIKMFSVNGSFKDGTSKREGFVAHRHDQAVMSVLVNGKCDLMPYGTIVSKEHRRTGEWGNENYLIYGH